MRLIDANALDREMREEYLSATEQSAFLTVRGSIVFNAVPVVRCRECDQYTPTICNRVYTVVKPWDFCSYGKPKRTEVRKDEA